MNDLAIKKWRWLVYPGLVSGLILVSLNVLFGQADLWVKLSSRQQSVVAQVDQMHKLQSKLAHLRVVDLEAEDQKLTYLLSVLPARKDLPVLLAQTQMAASTSGAVFEGFRGRVGEVAASQSAAGSDLQLEVSLQVADLTQLQRTLEVWETSLPLVKVKQVSLISGRADVVVERIWSPLVKQPAGSDYMATDDSTWEEIRDQLSSYSVLSLTAVASGSGDVKVSPFE